MLSSRVHGARERNTTWRQKDLSGQPSKALGHYFAVESVNATDENPVTATQRRRFGIDDPQTSGAPAPRVGSCVQRLGRLCGPGDTPGQAISPTHLFWKAQFVAQRRGRQETASGPPRPHACAAQPAALGGVSTRRTAPRSVPLFELKWRAAQRPLGSGAPTRQRRVRGEGGIRRGPTKGEKTPLKTTLVTASR